MNILDPHEFEAMEQILANLLNGASSDEEEKILSVHQRLQIIYEGQSRLRKSKTRLEKLRSRI